MIVVRGAVVGPPAPADVVTACGRLSRKVSADFLGVWFGRDWVFAGATPAPDLRLGGDALLSILAKAVREVE